MEGRADKHRCLIIRVLLVFSAALVACRLEPVCLLLFVYLSNRKILVIVIGHSNAISTYVLRHYIELYDCIVWRYNKHVSQLEDLLRRFWVIGCRHHSCQILERSFQTLHVANDCLEIDVWIIKCICLNLVCILREELKFTIILLLVFYWPVEYLILWPTRPRQWRIYETLTMNVFRACGW